MNTGEGSDNQSQRVRRVEDMNEIPLIPVVEETLRVGKETIETGRVRVSKRVTEHEELVDVPLVAEQVEVERIPINQFVDSPPVFRREGETMIIPVIREVMVKRLLVVEELRVTKRQHETRAPQQVTLRREEVNVERVDDNLNLDGA